MSAFVICFLSLVLGLYFMFLLFSYVFSFVFVTLYLMIWPIKLGLGVVSAYCRAQQYPFSQTG